ncbi:hypothetical protein MCCL_1535 [Macrococcoides caseolyticum JCSC5402]|uniref:Transmembrane protein n=1 Tax=Macrococcus caseolyticus (strain JCSC5402) TaxID=458233 RepID=B9E7S5_MACCJ|nr:hypothetical protein MCCL_1535 [Macrococcus caseolyticus JCSC5402]
MIFKIYKQKCDCIQPLQTVQIIFLMLLYIFKRKVRLLTFFCIKSNCPAIMISTQEINYRFLCIFSTYQIISFSFYACRCWYFSNDCYTSMFIQLVCLNYSILQPTTTKTLSIVIT